MCPAQPSRLDSWKAIAEYLGRNVRTATRWAEERAMPVHRVPGGKRGTVFAFAEEIDAWLAGQPDTNGTHVPGPPNGRHPPESGVSKKTEEKSDLTKGVVRRWFRPRAAFAALTVVLAIAVIPVARRSVAGPRGQVAWAGISGGALQAKNANGQTVWTWQIPGTLRKDYMGRVWSDLDLTRVSDVFGDGRKEVAAIVPTRDMADPGGFDHSELDFFSATGKLLWSYAPDPTFRFGDHDLKGPWFLMDVFVSQASGPRTLWAILTHHTWGNSFVTQIDPRTGRDALRFVNTGDLRKLSEVKTESDTYLLIGGFNNEWGSGSLAIVNEKKSFAASPQTPGSRHKCNSCPPGDADYYFVFPRSELARAENDLDDSVFDLRLTEEGIQIRKHEGFGAEETFYLLEDKPPFSVLSRRFDSTYDAVHRQWSAEGKISHSLGECPERLHPQPVRLWTPANGWIELPIEPLAANQ